MQLIFTHNQRVYKVKKIFKVAPLLAMLAFPMIASADYMDVIEFKLKDGCNMAKYMEIVKEFNVVAAENGYKAEILSPLQHNNLESRVWVGRTKNAESFGKAWDVYRSAQADANSSRGKLGARFAACSTLVARRSYETN